MYRTANLYNHRNSEDFDWETYFSPEKSESIVKQMDFKQVVSNLREHLKEDKFRLTLALSKVLWNLLQELELRKPRILELGAATGVLTRWLINQFEGIGVLVDSSKASYEAYKNMQDDLKENITYINEDIFKLDLEERFDLVCSFGLIEHFKDKTPVMNIHKRFINPQGIIVLLVPLDSPLTRSFMEVHPELNLGYRELLSEKEFRKILVREGLKVIGIRISKGYAYDFVGAVCRVE